MTIPWLRIVVMHGEAYSLFQVVDLRASTPEQPAIVQSFRSRPAAERWIDRRAFWLAQRWRDHRMEG